MDFDQFRRNRGRKAMMQGVVDSSLHIFSLPIIQGKAVDQLGRKSINAEDDTTTEPCRRKREQILKLFEICHVSKYALCDTS